MNCSKATGRLKGNSKLSQVKITLQGAASSDVSCPTVKSSSKRHGMGNVHKNALDFKFFEHLEQQKVQS